MEKFKALLELWKKKPLLSRLWVLGVLILFFSVEARTLFHHTGGSEARLLSTRRPLKAGMSLQIADLAVKHISGVSDRPLGAFTEKQVHEITGWIVKTDLREGQILTDETIEPQQPAVFSETVPRGLRAYGIELETTVPLTAGDRGDLQLIPQDEHQSPRLVSENCRLLGVKQTERTTRIVAAVTPEEATLLDDAQRKGRLNFILRNPRENQLQRKRKSHLRTRKKPTVEVITEE